MSVIAQTQENYYLYIKGAPEKIISLCQNPQDRTFFEQINTSMSGYRILALAYKNITLEMIGFKRE